ncbi:MAG: flippase-like domain-containing protein [Thermoguttaceae bacterium]|nr:flippase-like domain-containing protein [Thermoguttaceae bacterium]MDW8037633.1 lysylphosphatidylglycerol synthase transmembrane domain-containing protein [Thermoguttaceae bacterium]
MSGRGSAWNRVSTALKILLSLGIVAFLLYRAEAKDPDTFGRLWAQPKQWEYLLLATAACWAATFLTFVRWLYLVRALDLPLSFREGMRISFLGYLFNLAPMGIVGGDLLKAFLLARQQSGRRAQAAATVVVDRVLGLYILFVVAAVAIVAVGFHQSQQPELRLACQLTLAITLAGTAGMLMLFIPGLTQGRLSRLMAGIPKVGPILDSLLEAVRLYRHRWLVLVNSSLMSVGVHSLFAIGVFWIACGLYERVLPLTSHFVIMPISASMGVIPLPLGPFEAVLEFLYERTPGPEGLRMAAGQGLMVALAYRVITVLFAACGIFTYLGSRSEVAEALQQADLSETISQAQSRPS